MWTDSLTDGATLDAFVHPRSETPAAGQPFGGADGDALDLLLVDAYDGSRRAYAGLLRECGYSVVEARDGFDGMRIARERVPGLIVADPWPFFSGTLQMVERLRRAEATRSIPVLVVTSALAPECRVRALAAGCASFLEKPCAPERVLTEVRRLLPRTCAVLGAAR